MHDIYFKLHYEQYMLKFNKYIGQVEQAILGPLGRYLSYSIIRAQDRKENFAFLLLQKVLIFFINKF